MAKPISSFSFSIDDKLVQFTDTSNPNGSAITSWLWTLDGVTYSTQNISHNFSGYGSFLVSLETTNADGTDFTQRYLFIQIEGATAPNISIGSIVKLKAGDFFDDTLVSYMVSKWQLQLAECAGIAESDQYNESVWPLKWNMLIAEIVIYELITVAISQAIQAASSKSVETNSSTTGDGSNTSTTSNVKGPVKAIRTGPSEVEYYQISTSSDQDSGTADLVSSLTQSATGKTGLFQEYKSFLCGFAMNMGVRLPFCDTAAYPVIPRIYRK